MSRNPLKRQRSPEKNKRSHLRNLARKAERAERAIALLPPEQQKRVRREMAEGAARREATRKARAA
jgi:hypothetical protein